MFDSVNLPPPGGRLLPYISHIGTCRPKGLGFLGRFGLKKGVDFAHFDLESGNGFQWNHQPRPKGFSLREKPWGRGCGTTGLYERIYWFNSK